MSHFRKREDNRRLRKVAEATFGYYGTAVYFDRRKQRYIRLYPYSTKGNRKRFFRNQSNRRVRRRGELMNRGQHKKAFDLWWTLY